MRLFRFVILLALATILVVEPVVHTHPFAGSAGERAGLAGASICALCAVSAQQVTVVRAALVVPAIVVDLLVADQPRCHSFSTFRPLASRAPPAA